MISSKDQFLEMREAEQGINMEWSAPKEKPEVIDYSLNDFESLTEHHSKLKPDVKKVILDAVKEYKRLINQF